MRDLNVLSLCRVNCSRGKVPSPNEGKICPFPSSPLGEDLTTHKRRWEIDAEDTGMELLWSGVGVAQANSCIVHVFMGTRDNSQQEQPGLAPRGKLLAAFLLLQPFWMLERVGKDSIQHCVGAASVQVHLGAHPAHVRLEQCSPAMNLRIRIRSFIATLSLTFTNRSGANPQDGSVENNHSATPQLSSFALEELLILHYPLCGRLIFGPWCKG